TPPSETPADGGPEAPPAPEAKPPETPVAAVSGTLSTEVLSKVKRGTVYIRVDQRGSGSGFLGDEASVVRTNAHALGMLEPTAAAAKGWELSVKSGDAAEKKAPAEVLGVDRRHDLALLRVPRAGLPPPLVVRSAAGLYETQPLWVSGFPFGEGLGKNV